MVMVRAESLIIVGGREVGLPAVPILVLLRLLLGVPVVQLWTNGPGELALCIGLGLPARPSSSLHDERRRRVKIGVGRMPEGRGLRLRLIIGDAGYPYEA